MDRSRKARASARLAPHAFLPLALNHPYWRLTLGGRRDAIATMVEKADMAESITVPEIEAPLMLSDNAAKRIREIMQSEAEGSLLRISVSGGGCSGFQYAFDV